MLNTLDHGKSRGFAQIVLLVLLALGFLAAGGVYLAKRNVPAPVVASAPVVAPEPEAVVEQVATSTEPVPELEEPVTEPTAAPVVPVTKPVPSPTPVVAPAVVPVPVEADQLADDRYFLQSVLVVVRSDKEAWVKHSESAAGRRAAALRVLAGSVTEPGPESLRANWLAFKNLILADASGYDADKAGARASYDALYGPIEAAINARLATLTSTNLLTDAEVLKYGGYRAKAHAAATKVEDAATSHYVGNLDDIAPNLSLYETPEDAARLLAVAEVSGNAVVPRPVSP